MASVALSRLKALTATVQEDYACGTIPQVSLESSSLHGPSEYQYESLTDGQDFRLLLIAPGSLEDPICCNLSHVSFNEKPVYQALSYVWGDHTKTHSIKISNNTLPVTANVFAALKRFRLTDQIRPFWVDALCINQSNLLERSQQVGIMKFIYANAQTVQIWLGEEIESDELAFSVIRKLRAQELAHSDLRLKKEERHKLESPQCDFREEQAVWSAASALLRRPWFQRAWVVQEAVVATKAQIVCGSKHTCDFESIFAMFKWMDCEGLNILWDGIASRSISIIEGLRTQRRSGEISTPILKLVTLFRSRRTTDPRDMVFALLGITPNNKGIKADYSVSTEELYTEFSIRHLDGSRGSINFEILSYAGVPPTDSSLEIPSWVPNWDDLRTKKPRTSAYDIQSFQASGSRPPNVAFSVDKRIMHVSGFIFDTISRTTSWSNDFPDPDVPCEMAARDQVHFLRKFIEECDELARMAYPYPDGSPFREAYSRSFLFDQPIRDENGNEVPKERLARISSDIRHYTLHNPYFSRNDPNYDASRDYYEARQGFALTNRAICEKKLCVTSKRYLSWGPETAAAGDVVCIFAGAAVPVLLRANEDGYYRFVGECYVQGIMYGEALKMEGVVEQAFKIR